MELVGAEVRIQSVPPVVDVACLDVREDARPGGDESVQGRCTSVTLGDRGRSGALPWLAASRVRGLTSCGFKPHGLFALRLCPPTVAQLLPTRHSTVERKAVRVQRHGAVPCLPMSAPALQGGASSRSRRPGCEGWCFGARPRLPPCGTFRIRS